MCALRSLMPALANKSYFNYGGQGPLPNPSLQRITESWEKIQDLGPFTNSVWPYIANEIKTTREQLAKLCGVPDKRLALTENVTSGCVIPLWGLPFSKGDRILISDCEHPGVVAACRELAKRKSLQIDTLKVQKVREGFDKQSEANLAVLKSLEIGLKKKTKLVVLSHLLWNTGQLMPISAVAEHLSSHSNKPYLLVDAAQSFGQIPVQNEADSADIFAFTGHKWACGPEGLGGVAISERVLSESNPTLIGWRSLKNEGVINESHEDIFFEDSRRFEVATSCVPLMAGLRCSLNLIQEEASELERLKKIQQFSSLLWNELEIMNGVKPLLKGPPPAGLVSFIFPKMKSLKRIVNLLGQKKVWIRDLEDPLCLRACVNITSESAEIESLIRAIKEITQISD